MPYAHILVAVELTDEAPEVIAKAAELAQSNQSRLSIVNVVKPLAYPNETLASVTMAEMSIQFEREAVDVAHAEILRLCRDLDIDAEDIHVILGRPSSEIKALAEKLDVQLVVIGTHGQHGFGLLLGSTANGVLHGTSCDVLAVRVGTGSNADAAQ